MKKYYLLLLFLFCCHALMAQQEELDSLLQNLQKHPANDTIRLQLLLDITFDYNYIDPAKGLQTADEAIALARRLSNLRKLGTAYNYKGLNYTSQGNDTLALQAYNICLDIRRQMHDSRGIANAYHNIGISYFNLADYPRALNYQQQADSIFEKLNFIPGMAATRNSIGVVYLLLADYPKALDYYLKALRIYQQLHNTRTIASTFSNIGLVYAHLHNYPKSLEYQMKAHDIWQQSGDQLGLQNTLGNIGNIYSDSNEPDKALGYYQQALAINKKLNNNRGIASNLLNIAIVYYHTKNYQSALQYANKALALYESLNDKLNLSAALTYMAGIYAKADDKILLQNGIAPAQRFTKAVAYQRRGLQLAQETGSLSAQNDAWENLSEIYAAQKDFAQALQAYKMQVLLHDSIINDDKKLAISRAEMQYDFDSKQAIAKADHEKKEAVAGAEIKRQRTIKNSFAGGIAILIVAAIISFVFYKKRRDAEEQQQEAEFKAQVSDTEMKALRAQMNPHFIFNSLNSISDYIAHHDIENADYYLTKFARLMRMILENSEQKEIPLAEDMKALEIYMQLEALRLNNKFTYEINIADNIDQETTLVPPLMLQPFVENSIWHGIAQKEGTGKIVIEIKKEAEMINCVVEDNGVGIKGTGKITGKKSMGLKITKSRIDIINKLKKSKASVELSGVEEGTRVEVKLPITLNF